MGGTELDSELRREADDLLWSRGLHSLLSLYGTPQVGGSYGLRLMAWRDLDVYLVSANLTVPSFFDLGTRLAELLSPVKMTFRNEHLWKTPGLPRGLYWGIYLGDERAGAWKIDVWGVDQDEYDRATAASREIAGRLTDEYRNRILEIKSACWRDPRYRKQYFSMDIYAAVLDEGVASVPEFSDLLMRRKGFPVSIE